MSRGKLRQLIPVFEERTVDRTLLVEGQRNLVEYFQSQGYFDAAVDFSDEQTIRRMSTRSVTRSAQPALQAGSTLRSSGTNIFDTATLRERIVHHAGQLSALPLRPVFAEAAGTR